MQVAPVVLSRSTTAPCFRLAAGDVIVRLRLTGLLHICLPGRLGAAIKLALPFTLSPITTTAPIYTDHCLCPTLAEYLNFSSRLHFWIPATYHRIAHDISQPAGTSIHGLSPRGFLHFPTSRISIAEFEQHIRRWPKWIDSQHAEHATGGRRLSAGYRAFRFCPRSRRARP